MGNFLVCLPLYCSPKDGKFLHIGYFVFKADLPAKKKKLNTRDLVYQSQLINSEDGTKTVNFTHFFLVTATVDLEAGFYNIVACTYYPNLENSYTLSVAGACFTSPKEFYEISPEIDWKVVHSSGEWKSGKDGGCSNNQSTWKENPEFLINCPAKQTVKVVLETDRDVAIGFYLWKSHGNKLINL